MKKLLIFALLLPMVAFSNAIDNCFTFLNAGDFRRAVEEGKRAVKLYPKNPDAHHCLGKAYRLLGLLDQALESLKKAEKFETRKKELMYIYNDIGIVLEKKRNLDGALEYYMKSLSIARSLGERKMQASLLNNIGLIYHNKGDTDRALFYYTKSLELKEREEDKVITYNNIAMIYSGRGDYKKAEEFFKKALVASELAGNLRGSGLVLINLGVLYIQMKRYDLAREKLEEGIKRVERIGDVYWTAVGYENLGLLEMRLERYEKALEFFKRARELYIRAGAFRKAQEVDFSIKLTKTFWEYFTNKKNGIK